MSDRNKQFDPGIHLALEDTLQQRWDLAQMGLHPAIEALDETRQRTTAQSVDLSKLLRISGLVSLHQATHDETNESLLTDAFTSIDAAAHELDPYTEGYRRVVPLKVSHSSGKRHQVEGTRAAAKTMLGLYQLTENVMHSDISDQPAVGVAYDNFRALPILGRRAFRPERALLAAIGAAAEQIRGRGRHQIQWELRAQYLPSVRRTLEGRVVSEILGRLKNRAGVREL